MLASSDSHCENLRLRAASRITTTELHSLASIQALVVRCQDSDDRARTELRRLGILRTSNSPQGDYAEWLMARWFDLRLARNVHQKGWDAEDERGTTYQIKGRWWSPNTSFDGLRFSDSLYSFDYLLGVIFTDRSTYEIGGIICAPFDVIRANDLAPRNWASEM